MEKVYFCSICYGKQILNIILVTYFILALKICVLNTVICLTVSISKTLIALVHLL